MSDQDATQPQNADVEAFLDDIRSDRFEFPDSQALYTASAMKILRSMITEADHDCLANAIKTAPDKWIRVVAANAIRHITVQLLKDQFDAEQDTNVKIQLIFSICFLSGVTDTTRFESFIREHEEEYIQHNVAYSGGDLEKWREHCLGRLQDPDFQGNSWLYRLNLELIA